MDVFHFLHAVKQQRFYKLILSFLMEVTRHVQSIQNRRLVIFLQYFNKKILMKFIFCIQIKMKVSYKLIRTIWVCLAKENFARVG